MDGQGLAVRPGGQDCRLPCFRLPAGDERRSGPVSLHPLLPRRMDLALYQESGHLQASRGMLPDAAGLLTSSSAAGPAHSDAIPWPHEVFGKDRTYALESRRRPR